MLFFDPARKLRTDLQNREALRIAVLRTRRRWIYGSGATALAFLSSLVAFALFGTDLPVVFPMALGLTAGAIVSTIFFLNCLISYKTMGFEMEIERGDDELSLRFKEAGVDVAPTVFPWKHKSMSTMAQKERDSQ